MILQYLQQFTYIFLGIFVIYYIHIVELRQLYFENISSPVFYCMIKQCLAIQKTCNSPDELSTFFYSGGLNKGKKSTNSKIL